MNAARERQRLYGGAEALGGAEAFLANQGRSGPYVYWTALLSCTAALLALPVVRVDLSVQERGLVRPTAERSAIVARTSGFIDSIQAHDNNLVHAGDALVVLNTRELQARIDLNGSHRALLQKELADLNRLLEGTSTPSAVTLSDLQTAKYIAEYQKFDIECRRADLKVAQAEREKRRTQQLFADHAAPARDFEQASYEASTAQAEREIITRQTIAQWQADKAQKEVEAEQLQAETRRLAEERDLYSVKAPVDGTVLGLEGLFEGSYVQSGQRIGEISPTGELVVEAWVPPKDIGRIFDGQPVSLQVDAYPYTVWGLLAGRVIGISADYVQDGDSSRAFKVTIRPNRDHLQARQGLKGFLKKGMTVNARFFVARRSLAELLYENLDQSFNPAMNGAQEDHARAQ
jgi:HlyD family secretion protein